MLFGVKMDTLPYLIAIGLSVVVLLVFVMRRKHFRIDFDFAVGDRAITAVARAHAPRLLIFNPLALVIFFAAFGGIGLLAHGAGASSWLSAIIALLGGFAIAMLVYRAIVEFIFKRQSKNVYVLDDLVGRIAVVQELIPAQSKGTIVYPINQQPQTLIAYNAEQEPLEHGVEVVIVELLESIPIIRRLESLQVSS